LGISATAAYQRYGRIKSELEKASTDKTPSAPASATTSLTKKRKSGVDDGVNEELNSSPEKWNEPSTPNKRGRAKKSAIKMEVAPNSSDQDDS